MSRLHTQLARLYCLPDQHYCARPAGADEAAWRADGVLTPASVEQALAGREDAALQLVGEDGGGVRTLVVDFARSRDWPQVEALYRAVQTDLDLPAPAIAVRAHAGYALWLSLAEPVALATATAFLAALRASYLADLPPDALTLRPDAAAPQTLLLPLLPALAAASGSWSAFIDPTLGSLFVDEPWLEMAPNMDRQADLLASLKSIASDDFARARARLEETQAAQQQPAEASAAPVAEGAPAEEAGARRRRRRATLALGGGFADPASFLLALMNDPAASARQRIAAAKALLPYYGKKSD